MNGREVAVLRTLIESLWPNSLIRDASDDASRIAVWSAVLADVSMDEARSVLVEHSRTGAAFPPAVGQIAERVLTLREKIAGTLAPSLDLALAEVAHYVSRRGLHHGEPAEWSHRAVADAVRAIGWRTLCAPSNPETVRAHFIRVYESSRTRHVEAQRMTPFTRELIAGAQAALQHGTERALPR